MPKDRFAKYHAKGQIINERFEGAGLPPRPPEIGMRPSPITSVAITAIVALQTISQRLSRAALAIKGNFAGKNGVGMRGARKADPSFVAEDCPKM